MKKLLLNLFLIFISVFAFAQAPNAINYQLSLRNSSGSLLKNQSVGLRLSVLKGSASGSAVYTETHSVSTNDYGIVSLQIGNGSTTGNFGAIAWGTDAFYLKVELDEQGNSTYKNLGVTQFVAVPYAQYANTAGTVLNGDRDSLNELQSLSINGDKLSLDRNGGTVTLPDADPTNEIQKLSINGNFLTLSNNGGSVALPGGGSSVWTEVTDTAYYDDFVKIGNHSVISGPRLVVGNTRNNQSNFGIWSESSNGSINYGIVGVAEANGTNYNASNGIFGRVLTDNGNGIGIRATATGDESGDGLVAVASTNKFNRGIFGQALSQRGSPYNQIGGEFQAVGSGRASHYGIYSTAGNGGQVSIGGVLIANADTLGRGAEASARRRSLFNQGVFASADSGSLGNWGVYAVSRGRSAENYGVFATSIGSATNGVNYGLYASASGADTNWAGFFAGDLTYTGSLVSPSDMRLKKDIKSYDGSVLDKLLSIKIKSYTYRKEEYASMNLPEGDQIGFIAQEFQTIFPDLVKGQVMSVPDPSGLAHTSVLDNGELTTTRKIRFNGINYTGLIPVIVKGMQEQQAQIDKLQQEIDLLKEQNQLLKETLSKLQD